MPARPECSTQVRQIMLRIDNLPGFGPVHVSLLYGRMMLYVGKLLGSEMPDDVFINLNQVANSTFNLVLRGDFGTLLGRHGKYESIVVTIEFEKLEMSAPEMLILGSALYSTCIIYSMHEGALVKRIVDPPQKVVVDTHRDGLIAAKARSNA